MINFQKIKLLIVKIVLHVLQIFKIKKIFRNKNKFNLY